MAPDPRGNLVTPVGFNPTGYPVPLELTTDGELKIYIAGGAILIDHNLLDGLYHPDTVDQAPALGDIIAGLDQGGGVIKWEPLNGGADGDVLTRQADGTVDFEAPTASPEMLSGFLMMYAGSAAPSGWLFCDGSAVSRSTYAALFAVIGTTYGAGDGSTTFNLPDLRGRVPVGVGTGTGGGASGTGLPTGGAALTAISRATWKGEETHTLVTAELAAHTHGVPKETTGSAVKSLRGTNWDGSSVENTTSTGSGTAHNNIQPVIGVNFIIKT